MKSIVRLELLSNTVFGSGKSIPGGEDISIQTDIKGFPFLKGSTFKGILREEIENIVDWTGNDAIDTEAMFGQRESTQWTASNSDRVLVSDFTVPESIKELVNNEKMSSENVTDCFTNMYTFTSLENGIVKEGTLRSCRYINSGNVFYGTIVHDDKYAEIIKMGVSAIKFVGTMRTRGFGRVKVTIVGGE